MKKITYILLIIIILICAELFCARYLGISIRPHGAPLACKMSTDINDVLKCVRLQYMKHDAVSMDWNNNLSQHYLMSKLQRFYHQAPMSFSRFSSVKNCYGKTDCSVTLKNEKYRIDAYQDLIAYVKINPRTQSYTYDKSNQQLNHMHIPSLWEFSRSYKFPYHDIVIGSNQGKNIFYILSMEAVPLDGSYDLIIGSITAFCEDEETHKKYICEGYRFYFYDDIRHDIKNFSLSLDKRHEPEYLLVKYGNASYRIKLHD